MYESWVKVEDDTDIFDAGVDEAIELLEKVNFYNALIDDGDDPEDIMPIKQKYSCTIIFRCINQC